MKAKINSKKKTKKSEEKKKESRLEQEIKEIKELRKEKKEIEPEFFEEPVRQISIAEIGAPVLERIIQRETPPTQISAETQPERNEKRIDYSPSANQPNYGFSKTKEDGEKKYEINFVPPVLSRREMRFNAANPEFINQQEENSGNKTNELQLDKIEFVEQRRKLPLEEEQKKYKRFKLR